MSTVALLPEGMVTCCPSPLTTTSVAAELPFEVSVTVHIAPAGMSW